MVKSLKPKWWTKSGSPSNVSLSNSKHKLTSHINIEDDLQRSHAWAMG